MAAHRRQHPAEGRGRWAGWAARAGNGLRVWRAPRQRGSRTEGPQAQDWSTPPAVSWQANCAEVAPAATQAFWQAARASRQVGATPSEGAADTATHTSARAKRARMTLVLKTLRCVRPFFSRAFRAHAFRRSIARVAEFSVSPRRHALPQPGAPASPSIRLARRSRRPPQSGPHLAGFSLSGSRRSSSSCASWCVLLRSAVAGKSSRLARARSPGQGIQPPPLSRLPLSGSPPPAASLGSRPSELSGLSRGAAGRACASRSRRPVATRAAKDYYDLLGVPRGTDAKEVKKAYRQLARKYHPVRLSSLSWAAHCAEDVSAPPPSHPRCHRT